MTVSNVHLLRQGVSLLNQLDDELYMRVLPEVTQAGIGAHLRHCLDFYSAFLRGIGQGKVNYDLRERNELIETSRLTASAKISATRMPRSVMAGLAGFSQVIDHHLLLSCGTLSRLQ